MASEWEYRKIADVAEKVACGPFGTAIKVSTFVPEGVPVISGQHLHGSRLQEEEYNYISDEHADRLKNANVFCGDVIFTAWGSIGQVAYIPNNSRYARYVVSQRQFYMRCDTERVLPAFVTYYFKTGEGQHRLTANSSPTGVPSIAQPVTYLKSLTIPVPPLKEQEAIVRILGDLDDKIELNQWMNETLESIARAIFKSWFVEFDPVRAKADGRQPTGMDSETAALFPSSLENSGLGSIPSGWAVGKLSDLCTTQYGYTASATEKAVGPKFLRVKDINKLDWIEWDNVPHCEISEQNKEKYGLKTGDIVVARMADPGKSAIIDDDVDAVFASYLVRIQASSLDYAYFIYFFLKSALYKEYVAGVKGGSVQANMNARVMVDVSILVPPPGSIKAFSSVVMPLRRRLTMCTKESSMLSDIRDTLLPKLISGEIRIKDAEKFVEEHVG